MSRPAGLAVGALVAAAALVLVVVLGGGGGSYVVRAQFTDGGQLVRGDLVEVGGRRVGTVRGLDVTDDGLAEVELRIDDEELQPLRLGTRAAIRTVGLSGVANRFVDLRPGPGTTEPIPDGGVIPTTHTRGVVDLDAVLNAFDPELRADVQTFIREAGVALTATTAEQGNAGLRVLNPAISQLNGLGRELTADQAALSSLLRHTSSLAGSLARHRAALGSGLDDTAGVLAAIAAEREALAAGLALAPGAMTATTRTLRRLRTRTLPALDPVVRGLRPAVGPLGDLVRELVPALRDARPLIARLRALVPQSRAALSPLPRRERAARPAMRSITRALSDALPVVSGLRPYTPDLVAGLFHGFGGSTAASYDANGHFGRIMLTGGSQTGAGLVPRPPAGTLDGLRTGLVARCPGAAEEPAPDGSNPWPEGGGAACDPEHSP